MAVLIMLWIATEGSAQKIWTAAEWKSLWMDTAQLRQAIVLQDTLDPDSMNLIQGMVPEVPGQEGQRIHTGGLGYPSHPLLWQPAPSPSPATNFMLPVKPVTRIGFMAGGSNLQAFKVGHHQRLGPALTTGIQVHQLTHEGYLPRSGSRVRFAEGYLTGSLRPGRHWMHLNGRRLRTEITENGGLPLPGFLPVAAGYNPLNLEPWLRNASTNRYNDEISLVHRWRHQTTPQAWAEWVYRVDYVADRWQFADEAVSENLGYYSNPASLKDSTSGRDSLNQSTWTQTLGLHQMYRKHEFSAGLEWMHLRYYTGPADSLSPGIGQASMRKDQGAVLVLSWQSPMAWYFRWRQGLYHSYMPLATLAELGWRSPRTQRGLHAWSVQLQSEPPSYRQRLLQVNAQGWNLPSLQSSQSLTLRSEWLPLKQAVHRWVLGMGLAGRLTGLQLQSDTGFSTWNTSYRWTVQQDRGVTAFVFLDAKGLLGPSGGRGLHWRYHHLFQWNNRLNWAAVPFWACDDWFYYQRRTAAGWKWLAGLAIRYHTSFLAPSYRPELGGAWTLTSEVRSGAYPMTDLLAGLKVKQTLLYLRLEHANQGWPRHIGALTPAYPLGDRRLRLGLDWKFLD